MLSRRNKSSILLYLLLFPLRYSTSILPLYYVRTTVIRQQETLPHTHARVLSATGFLIRSSPAPEKERGRERKMMMMMSSIENEEKQEEECLNLIASGEERMQQR